MFQKKRKLCTNSSKINPAHAMRLNLRGGMWVEKDSKVKFPNVKLTVI